MYRFKTLLLGHNNGLLEIKTNDWYKLIICILNYLILYQNFFFNFERVKWLFKLQKYRVLKINILMTCGTEFSLFSRSHDLKSYQPQSHIIICRRWVYVSHGFPFTNQHLLYTHDTCSINLFLNKLWHARSIIFH